MRASSVEFAILDLLEQNNCHLTALEVHHRLQKSLPALSPSTVYRALERLAHNGKISVSDMGTGASVYEKVTDGMHHHLVCQHCGHVETISHELVGALFDEVMQKVQFKVATNHLILFGECAACREQKKRTAGPTRQ